MQTRMKSEEDLKTMVEKQKEEISNLKIEKREEKRRFKELEAKHKIENEEEKRKFRKLAAKHKSIVEELSDKIECPVCWEIPRTGPVPVCPNGHLVCINCNTQQCPTCRVSMGEGKSLLAVTVIENIEHKCKFDDCDEYLAVRVLDDHAKICKHRTVSCPNAICKVKLGLSKLVHHLVDGCSYDPAPRLIGKFPTVTHVNYTMKEENKTKNDMSWKVYIFKHGEMTFGIVPEKFVGIYYFSFVMFSEEEECSKYKLELTLHERASSIEGSEVSYRFCGRPCSIDGEKGKLKYLGLSVTSEGMEQIVKKSANNAFSLSFSINTRK